MMVITVLKEFKEFAMRGNVLDLAIAVVIGGAFGQIVTALVEQIIMPFVGVLLGGIDLTGKSFLIGESVIGYGMFIQSIFDFIIIAFAIFLFVKLINRLKRKKEEQTEEAPSISKEEQLLTEIRDLLKAESTHK